MSHFTGNPIEFGRSRSRHHGFDGQHYGYDGQHHGYDGQHHGYDGQHLGFGGQTEILTTTGFDDGSRYHGHRDEYNRYPDAVTTTGTRIINVDDGHRSRRRHRHRQEPQVITTSGTQVLTTSGNNIIPTGATVINADTSRHHRRRRRSGSHRYYDPERPSSFHGFCNRIFGALGGNSRRRRHGRREMREASAIRKAKHVAQDVQENGHRNKLRRFHRHRNRHHRHHNNDAIVVQQDATGPRPWLHHHRTPTPYSGYGNLILGYLTGNRDRRAMGSAMLVAAREQRRGERHRRHNDNYDAAREYRSRRY